MYVEGSQIISTTLCERVPSCMLWCNICVLLCAFGVYVHFYVNGSIRAAISPLLAPLSLAGSLPLSLSLSHYIFLSLSHSIPFCECLCLYFGVYECHIYVILRIAYALPLHVIVHSECNAIAAAAAAVGNNFQLLCAYKTKIMPVRIYIAKKRWILYSTMQHTYIHSNEPNSY